MRKTKKRPNISEEARFSIQQRLEPYMEIEGISESRDAVYYQGTWRSEDSGDLANMVLAQEPLFTLVKSDGRKGIIKVAPGNYSEDHPKYWLHALLFVLTVFTTLFAGAMMAGYKPFPDLTLLRHGIPFSFTLLLILGTHELGHFFTARKHRVDATLPYFIPAPTFIGTFGAFIKMKSPVVNKGALLEIGAAGPIAGFIMTIPALFIGLSQSSIVTTGGGGSGITLGNSIIMWLATHLMFPNMGPTQDVMLSPVAFAAWIGLLVTALNLLPIGQLDGGHISYALFGEKHKWIARVAFAALIPLSFLSLNWLVWAALIFFLIRVQHPPIAPAQESLAPYQKIIGWIAIGILVGTFIPQPISM